MITIRNYMNDGANWQAQCVLAYLRRMQETVTDCAWNEQRKKSDAEIQVGRFENCREQGYVFSLWYNYKQVVHYAVYEHRNSDSLIVWKFNGNFINTPRPDDFMVNKSKYDYTKSFNEGEIIKCGDWLIDEMRKELLCYAERERLKEKILNND